MDTFVDAVLGMLSAHSISPISSQIFTTSSKMCPLLLANDATSQSILGEGASVLRGLNDPKCQMDTKGRICRVTCIASILNYLVGIRQKEEAPKSSTLSTLLVEVEDELVSCLLTMVSRSPAIPDEVDAGTLCLAKIYPRAGQAAVDSACDSMTQVGGGKLPVEASVDLLGHVADQLATTTSVDPAQLHECREVIIQAALKSVQLVHRELTTVPLVVRRVLLPLLQCCTGDTAAKYKAVALGLVHEFAKDENRLPEAVVLTAALFDVFMAPNTPGEAPHEADDLRRSPKFWSMLMQALRVVTKFLPPAPRPCGTPSSCYSRP